MSGIPKGHKSTLYNLLDEGWIPVLWHDGTVNRIGIKDALAQAHRIRQIAATNFERLAPHSKTLLQCHYGGIYL